MEYQDFISGYWPILVFFVVFPVGLALILFWLLEYDLTNLTVSIGLSVTAFLVLSLEYCLRLRGSIEKKTLEKYVEQFEMIRALSTSLISIVGIFISILGTGALFGDATLTLPIVLAFSTLILSLIIGFISLAEIIEGIQSQESSKLCISSTKWGSFWYSARYQLTLFIFSIVLVVAGIVLFTPSPSP